MTVCSVGKDSYIQSSELREVPCQQFRPQPFARSELNLLVRDGERSRGVHAGWMVLTENVRVSVAVTEFPVMLAPVLSGRTNAQRNHFQHFR